MISKTFRIVACTLVGACMVLTLPGGKASAIGGGGGGGGAFSEIEAGAYYTCALETDGKVLCWGDDSSNQIDPPEATFIQISAGWDHTCGVKSDTKVACWGSDDFGKASPPDGDFTQVSAGLSHSCGVTTGGAVACWGYGDDGETTVPTPNSGFSQVSVGYSHSCGLKATHSVVCWGDNTYSQLTPPTSTLFNQVDAGDNYTCGIKTDGSLVCWGSDDSYALTTPPSGSDFSQVSAGHDHACAVRTNGTVACWGNSYAGTPPTSNMFNQVSAGFYYHSCALQSDHAGTCWGSNDYHQAGPLPPSSLSGHALGLTSIELSWTDNSSDETQFRMERSLDGTNDWSQIGTSTVNDYTDSNGLSENTIYYYRVRAYRSGDDRPSAYSNIAHAPTTVPTVFSILRANSNPTSALSVDFTVTFSQPVTGVDTHDFTLTKTGITGGSVTGVTGSGALRTVTVNTGTGNGTIRLNLIDNDSILDEYGAKLGGDGIGNGNFTTGQTYTVQKSTTFQSAGSQDGWILESGENTTVGGTLDSINHLRLGDDASRKQYRSILSFNTGGLPDHAIITSVKLTLTKQGIVGGGNPFSIFQGMLVDVKKGFFGTTAALQTTDFQITAGKSGLGPFSPALVGGRYTITLPSTAFPYINALTTNNGLTQFRLRFKLGDNNNTTANFISFYSGNYGTAASRPALTVEYHAP